MGMIKIHEITTKIVIMDPPSPAPKASFILGMRKPSKHKGSNRLKVEKWIMRFLANTVQRKAGIAIGISEKQYRVSSKN